MHLLLPVTLKKNNEYRNSKALPRQQLARANQKSNPTHLEGLPHDMHHRTITRRRDLWWETQTKNADNIEILAKDDNITGGNSFMVLTCSLK